ncbi:hypothetical protein [uncultured Polaribacter sp.]|uniref:hypothetical protein n=1 Tax=uncultured Polaribacter sp. TaxID=174711 RepID=UPI0026262A86|nr:hypothetical protein [uncultured Polaribacter sp.]
MIVEKKKTYTLISSDESSLKEFQKSILNKIELFKKDHLVFDISDEINGSTEDFLLFLKIAEQKQQNGMSFVIINSSVNVDDFPENLNIVPTLQEAEDILEMEAIERSLGF